jgi:hypothetical protein
MAKIPKPRKPGQTGNWSGQGKNAQAFNARQNSGKKRMACGVLLIAVGVAGIVTAMTGFGIAALIL